VTTLDHFDNFVCAELCAISRTLMNEWDPIGVADHSGAEDEYDHYVLPIYLILNGQESVSKVASQLSAIRTEQMGLPSNELSDRRVAELLVKLHRQSYNRRLGQRPE
jgi:hypothetical protein